MPVNEKIEGNNPQIRQVRRKIRKVAPSELNLLIIGEPGTEKAAVATAVHDKSLRSSGKLLVMDCLEYLSHDEKDVYSEFRKRFLECRNGTLFIDNADKLNERQLANIASTVARSRKQNISHDDSVSGTARVLAGAAGEGFVSHAEKNFILAINEFCIEIPPLRKRKQDIPVLLHSMLKMKSAGLGRPEPPGVPEKVLSAMLEYDWPGNIAELDRTVNIMLELSGDEELQSSTIPFLTREDPFEFLTRYSYQDAINSVEKYLVEKALTSAGWNRTKAAASLGMTEGNIRLKIKKHKIRQESKY